MFIPGYSFLSASDLSVESLVLFPAVVVTWLKAAAERGRTALGGGRKLVNW